MPASLDKENINLAFRTNLAVGIIAFFFLVLIGRLWYLQIVNGAFFRNESENNRIRKIFVPAPRGRIMDRNGLVLVKNRPSFNVDLVREDCPNPKLALARLARILGLETEFLTEKIKTFESKRRRFEPRLILKDAGRDAVAKVLARRYELPGIVVNVVPTREYVFGEFAAHALGYIREINAAQLKLWDRSVYRAGDLVGQVGIEKAQELLLQGKRGIKKVIVNALGVRTGEANYEFEKIGHSVTLTLDYDVQKAVEKAMEDKMGAVVALAPESGEILALVSRPGFDPNVMAGEFTTEFWKELSQGKEKRLLNRVMQGSYPLGSVFKFVVATAALAEGVIGKKDRIKCSGSYRVGKSRPFMCWKKTGHGSLTIKQAIQRSCNVFFYTIGQRLGIDRIHEYASRYGFGQYTGIDLRYEKKGLIPSTKWKKEAFKNRDPSEQKWYAGETPSVSIGQGAVEVTPLQIARALAALVNGGRVFKPYLVKRIRSRDGAYDEKFLPEKIRDLKVDKWVLDAVRGGLEAVVNEPGGTGGRASLREMKIKVAGKTGTAQRRSSKFDTEDDKLEDNAWFAGYAPAEKAEIVVVALVVGGGHGGSAAAPVVKKVMEAFFKKKEKNVL